MASCDIRMTGDLSDDMRVLFNRTVREHRDTAVRLREAVYSLDPIGHLLPNTYRAIRVARVIAEHLSGDKSALMLCPEDVRSCAVDIMRQVAKKNARALGADELEAMGQDATAQDELMAWLEEK